MEWRCSVDLTLLNTCQLSTEWGQGRVQVRPYIAMELINLKEVVNIVVNITFTE